VLLGLVREDRGLTSVALPSKASMDAIREQIEEHTTFREKTSTSVYLPLSNESKRVLASAAEDWLLVDGLANLAPFVIGN